jgi:hypothetical protein
MPRPERPAKPDRVDQLNALLASCHRLLLDPRDEEARTLAVLVLGAAALAERADDTRLATALVAEARAHAEELAFRLEAPGYSSLYIRAVTARLCQTLQVLRVQFMPLSHSALIGA